jgi:hypothetical protein
VPSGGCSVTSQPGSQHLRARTARVRGWPKQTDNPALQRKSLRRNLEVVEKKPEPEVKPEPKFEPEVLEIKAEPKPEPEAREAAPVPEVIEVKPEIEGARLFHPRDTPAGAGRN